MEEYRVFDPAYCVVAVCHNMGILSDLETLLVNSDEGFVKSFIDNLSDLFTNKKTDIIDLLDNVEKEKLPLLRIRLFIQLVEKFPHLEKYELLTRGETQLLLKDILIIGQCIHEHKESPEHW